MTNPHHDATKRNERRGGKAELFGAEKRGNNHVAASFKLAISFHNDTAAEIVEEQCLVRLGEAEFPWDARVFDAGLRRGASAAIVTTDEHNVRVSFGDAGGNGADTDFGDELHADPRFRVSVLEVVDEFREIFDGINVVMGRR